MEWVGSVVAGVLGIAGIAGAIVTNELRARREERERREVASAARADASAERKREQYRELLDELTVWTLIKADHDAKRASYGDLENASRALLAVCARARLVASAVVDQWIDAAEHLTAERPPARPLPTEFPFPREVYDGLAEAMRADLDALDGTGEAGSP